MKGDVIMRIFFILKWKLKIYFRDIEVGFLIKLFFLLFQDQPKILQVWIVVFYFQIDFFEIQIEYFEFQFSSSWGRTKPKIQ